jgi:hypothetical protein
MRGAKPPAFVPVRHFLFESCYHRVLRKKRAFSFYFMKGNFQIGNVVRAITSTGKFCFLTNESE